MKKKWNRRIEFACISHMILEVLDWQYVLTCHNFNWKPLLYFTPVFIPIEWTSMVTHMVEWLQVLFVFTYRFLWALASHWLCVDSSVVRVSSLFPWIFLTNFKLEISNLDIILVFFPGVVKIRLGHEEIIISMICLLWDYSSMSGPQWSFALTAIGGRILVRSQRLGCLVNWFHYQLIAKPINKTAHLCDWGGGGGGGAFQKRVWVFKSVIKIV